MKLNKNILGSVILLILDFLWLGLFMGKQYRGLILNIQKSEMKLNYISAGLAYLMMIIGLNNFVFKYNMSNIDAFLFGMCLYGVYDFTCGAIFNNWDFKLAIIDILWGGFVYFLTNMIVKYINK